MARRFLDDIRDEIQTLLPDNISGQITPERLRGLLTDIVDSTVQDEATVSGDTGSTVTLTADFQPIGDGFDTTIGGDGEWLKPDESTGTIVLNTQPGWTYTVLAICTCQVAQNESLEFCILRNGTPGFFKPTIQGAGASRPVSVQMIDEVNANLSDEEIQIGVRALDGSASMDVIDIVLEVTIQPTNNP